jgi:hypothetical protein
MTLLYGISITAYVADSFLGSPVVFAHHAAAIFSLKVAEIYLDLTADLLPELIWSLIVFKQQLPSGGFAGHGVHGGRMPVCVSDGNSSDLNALYICKFIDAMCIYTPAKKIDSYTDSTYS